MSEIVLKNPAFKNRDNDTVVFQALVTVGDICCCTVNTIDISGLTIAATGALTYTLSGFEAESDLALDSGRRASAVIKQVGTIAGVTAAEYAASSVVSALITGTAGSRIITVTHQAAAFTWLTDKLTNAVIEFSLPVKAKDF